MQEELFHHSAGETHKCLFNLGNKSLPEWVVYILRNHWDDDRKIGSKFIIIQGNISYLGNNNLTEIDLQNKFVTEILLPIVHVYRLIMSND